MVMGTLKRIGDSLAVAIPPEEIARLGLSEGQLVEVEIRPAKPEAELADDLREAVETELRLGADALRYLAEH
jgi:antitoxin component of MazEF toxin-antitoxin module